MGCVLETMVAGVCHQEDMKSRASKGARGRKHTGAEISEFSGARFYGQRKGEQEWPSWLVDVAGDAIKDWTPRYANTFKKIDKIGNGAYSNVYKARDLITGKIVALKKVRFENLEPESVKFMAREILVLRKLDHPNVIKLEGLAISRMSSSLYLVLEYMEHDLAGLAAAQGAKLTEPQVKCFMKQLLSGLEHCHSNGVLHRDIKGSNLLIDSQGILKIADFGLASFNDPEMKHPMTSCVVTLWYRPPELLLGATYYGVGIDLWSVGCVLAELFAGEPIMPGRTEVEQLHIIFRLCGSPTEEYWKKSKLPKTTCFKPQQPYNRCIAERFNDFPPASLPLIEKLLAWDPDERGTATAAAQSKFFTTYPYACEPSSLPKYPPSKEMDVKLRHEAARRKRGASCKNRTADGKIRVQEKVRRAFPAPESNLELRSNLDMQRVMTHANVKSRSEKFPPPHQDGAGPSSFGTSDVYFTASNLDRNSSRSLRNSSASAAVSRNMRNNRREDLHMNPSGRFTNTIPPSSFRLSLDL